MAVDPGDGILAHLGRGLLVGRQHLGEGLEDRKEVEERLGHGDGVGVVRAFKDVDEVGI